MVGDRRKDLLASLITHYDELKAHLTRKFGPALSAQELVHDTYLRVQSLKTVPDIQNSRAYLYRVAENLAIDSLRADRRRQAGHASIELDQSHPIDLPGADEVAIHRERLRLLERTIKEMPRRQRTVFLMHKIDGLSHMEIARRLGVSKSMVEKHVMRGMKACREQLRRMDDDSAR